MFRSRDDQVRAVATALEDLLADLQSTVDALAGVLAPAPAEPVSPCPDDGKEAIPS
jgi:hypothetical protein